jgi:hypothetical protein
MISPGAFRSAKATATGENELSRVKQTDWGRRPYGTAIVLAKVC